ncbi:MAG: autotransporter-associated beta strand repeat-containing protein [Verrucomicrobiota bacterium]
MKPRLNSLPAVACFTMTFALAVTAAKAQTFNGSNTNWSTITSWTPNGVPAPGANIIIADTTTNGLLLDGTTSRSIGSLTFGASGTRATSFTVHTQAANTLTIAGGIVANGAFATTPTALAMRGNFTISADQTWSVGGSNAHASDQGVFFREATAPATTRGTVNLNANVTKAGAGQLIFGATDLLGAGNITVDAGDIKINAGSSLLVTLGGAGNFTFNNATTFAVYRNSGTLTVSRPVVMNGTSTFVTRGGANSGGNIDIASSIAFNGTHTLDVAQSIVTQTTNLNGAWTGAGTVNRIGTGNLNLAGTLSGFSGTLNLTTGTTTLANAFGGSVVLSAGASLNGEATTTGSLTLNGGNISVNPTTGASLGTLGTLNLTGTNNVTLTSAPVSTAPFPVLTYGTLGSGGIANLNLVGGAGNFRSAVFDATTTPGVITLAVGSEVRTWNGGAAWDINGSTNWLEGDQKFYQLDNVIFGNTGAGIITITGNVMPSSMTVNSTSDYEFTATAGNLISGSGGLTKSGSGMLTLGGANTFSGNIAVNGGVLKPTTNTALGGISKTITIASGATLDTNGAMTANNDYAAVISGTGVDGTGVIVNNSVTGHNNGFGSLTLVGNATIGGVSRWDLRPIAAGSGLLNLGGFTLEKTGFNQVGIIDSVATADGTININSGILSFTRSVVSGAGSVNVNLGGTLYFENNTTGSFSKALSLDDGTVRTFGNPFTISSAVTLTNFPLIQTDTDLTITGEVTGTGNLNKTGAAALILSNNVTHSNGTTVNAGTLQIGAGGSTGTLNADILNSGTVAFNRSDAISYGNLISGTGALTKMGTGTLTLTTAQGYAGNTNINAGTLIPGGSNFVPVVSLLNFTNTAGAIFDMSGMSHEFRGLAGGGTTGGAVINSGGGTQVLTLRPTGADNSTYVGQVLDGIRVVIAGDKTVPSAIAPRQRFDGTANTYTGGTLIDGGTLMARLDSSLGAVPASFDDDNIILQNNGLFFNEAEGVALDVNANRGILIGPGGGGLTGGFNSAGVIIRGVISGAAGNTITVVPNNSPLVFAADNTYAGDTILLPANGALISRLVIGDGGTTGTHGSGNILNDGRLFYNRSDTFTETATISGVGVVRQMGVGNVVLSAINTYTGNTELLSGTFTLSNDAGMKFAVTDAASNRVFAAGAPGAATVVFNGDFTIDTSAVTVTTGTWSLVDVDNLNETFSSDFTVAGGWTQDANVWSMSAGGVNWSFSESTGVLSVAPAGGTYAAWIGGFDFSAFPGADLTADGDADGDGIRNAVEMVIGNQPNQTKVENLPTITLVTNPAGVPPGDYLKFSYRRTTTSTSAGITSGAQYDVDLTGTWTGAVDNVAGVEIIETANALIPGHDVDVYIPRSLAAGGTLFGRLSAVVP